jgi:hypothetical protein
MIKKTTLKLWCDTPFKRMRGGADGVESYQLLISTVALYFPVVSTKTDDMQRYWVITFPRR